MAKDKRRDLRAYRKKVAAAKARAKKQQRSGTPTLCWICKNAIDLDLPYHDGMAFTLDHQTALANEGHILGPLLPAHRSCNSSRGKGDRQPPQGLSTRQW